MLMLLHVSVNYILIILVAENIIYIKFNKIFIGKMKIKNK